ncbi:phagosome assembly factor 1-like isoform X1 [Centruroides vittatus]|uniref:phagosome assembly factor 1-like isoform X1 n=2 Tax=Centruroides vittatus TaxID=120091 RepID=UPI00350EAC03
MLELEVLPECSLRNDQVEFALGMIFNQAVQMIQKQCEVIKNVQVLYSEPNPLSMDLVINLSQDGIRLIFEPKSQSLKIIEVYSMNKVKLKYCGIPFCSPEVPPTLDQIDHSFGATHPGEYDASQQLYILNFRGLSFSFPVDSKFQPRYTPGLRSLHFPNGASVVVSTKMCIYSGNNYMDPKPPAMPVACFYNYCYLEKLEVLRKKDKTLGLKLYLITEAPAQKKSRELKRQTITKTITFGNTAQDITSLLGSPPKIFFKAEDKMKIHSPRPHRFVASTSSDYFFNYTTLGMDILFDSKCHRAKKFILHTNYPGHYNFNMYFRCNFSIPINSQSNDSQGAILVDVTDQNVQLISAFTKWDTIQDRLIKPDEQPVVLNRSNSLNSTNPFGSTFCYGYQDMIFEIMSSNHIASVTLYQR